MHGHIAYYIIYMHSDFINQYTYYVVISPINQSTWLISCDNS